MIATDQRVVDIALGERRTAELAAEHHQRIFQQAALLQILDQTRRGLIDLLAAHGKALLDRQMVIPAHGKQGLVFHAAFGEPARDETVTREGAGLVHVGPIQLQH